jgi:hypothetical protein
MIVRRRQSVHQYWVIDAPLIHFRGVALAVQFSGGNIPLPLPSSLRCTDEGLVTEIILLRFLVLDNVKMRPRGNHAELVGCAHSPFAFRIARRSYLGHHGVRV